MPPRKRLTAEATDSTPTTDVVTSPAPVTPVEDTPADLESDTAETTDAADGATPAPLPRGMAQAEPAMPPAVVYAKHDQMIQEIGLTTRAIFAALSQPFEPELLYYKPQTMSRDRKSCIVAVYADPRAYIDRLNDVVGPENWSTQYETHVVPFKGEKGWGENRKEVSGHKLLVYCHLSITGMGTHTEIGESMTDNDNAATVAMAMAFKRACVTYGLGRYLYDFPKGVWAKYDEVKKRVAEPPPLPAFAYPVYECHDCHQAIGWAKGRNPENPEEVIDLAPRDVKDKSLAKFGVPLCGPCVRTRVQATVTPEVRQRLVN